MSSDCGSKLEYLEETHASTWRTCKLHTATSWPSLWRHCQYHKCFADYIRCTLTLCTSITESCPIFNTHYNRSFQRTTLFTLCPETLHPKLQGDIIIFILLQLSTVQCCQVSDLFLLDLSTLKTHPFSKKHVEHHLTTLTPVSYREAPVFISVCDWESHKSTKSNFVRNVAFVVINIIKIRHFLLLFIWFCFWCKYVLYHVT